MTSYDLFLPKESYTETEKLLDNNKRVAHNKYVDADRSYDKSVRISAIIHRNQRERYLATIQELRKELGVQETVLKFSTDKGGRFDREKRHWLSHGSSTIQKSSLASFTMILFLVGPEGTVRVASFTAAFLQYCIMPRCLLSPMDADYCVRILRGLHEWGTPGYHTLMLYDRVSSDMRRHTPCLPMPFRYSMNKSRASSFRAARTKRGTSVKLMCHNM